MKRKSPCFPFFAALIQLCAFPVAAQTSQTINGNLSVTGWGKFTDGVDLGSNAEASFNWLAPQTTAFDIISPSGVFLWRDTITSAPSAKNKMQLDAANALTLYKSDGTSGIILAPATGRLTLPAGTDSGIYFGSNTTATVRAAANGSAIFSGQVTLQNGLQVTSGNLMISSLTPSTSSATGALTVTGGLGVAMDSYINGVRIGRGNGNAAMNTTVGHRVLESNTTGDFNTGMGVNTMMRNTAGIQNSAFGVNSLHFNTSGSWNAAFGTYSLYASTGGANTAYGSRSLFWMGTGSNNTALGYGAGEIQSNGTNLTSTNNSIYIGANSRGFNNLDNNSIVIGANAVGEGANTTVIGSAATTRTRLFGVVNTSALTVNSKPVITSSFGVNSNLSVGAALAIGDYASATGFNSVAIGSSAQSDGASSIALGESASCGDGGSESVALNGGRTTKSHSLASAYGEANGEMSFAFGYGGVATGDSSIALGGLDYQFWNYPSNQSVAENSATLGGVGNQALGFSSFATGFWTKAAAYSSVSMGSLNLGGATSDVQWVETDPLFELGNGNAPRGNGEPAASSRSNAITTLKNGQTTLTNKVWKSDPAVTPSASNSNGEALVVEGHTRLKGKVVIEQAQGDISMGIYQ